MAETSCGCPPACLALPCPALPCLALPCPASAPSIACCKADCAAHAQPRARWPTRIHVVIHLCGAVVFPRKTSTSQLGLPRCGPAGGLGSGGCLAACALPTRLKPWNSLPRCFALLPSLVIIITCAEGIKRKKNDACGHVHVDITSQFRTLVINYLIHRLSSRLLKKHTFHFSRLIASSPLSLSDTDCSLFCSRPVEGAAAPFLSVVRLK
jgi:hypothetical protein